MCIRDRDIPPSLSKTREAVSLKTPRNISSNAFTKKTALRRAPVWGLSLIHIFTILAKSRDDFPAIREETERRRQEYDTVIGENGYSLIYRNRPYDQEKNAAGMAANIEPDRCV